MKKRYGRRWIYDIEYHSEKKTGEDYLPVETVGIQAETRILSGDGTIKNPFREEVRLKIHLMQNGKVLSI